MLRQCSLVRQAPAYDIPLDFRQHFGADQLPDVAAGWSHVSAKSFASDTQWL
jgi:hypothetical protein